MSRLTNQPQLHSNYKENDDNDVSIHDLFAKVRNMMSRPASNSTRSKPTITKSSNSTRKPFQDITNLTTSSKTGNIRNTTENKNTRNLNLNLPSIATKLETRINKLMSLDSAYENYHDMMKVYKSQQKELHEFIHSDYMISVQSSNSCLTWNHRRLLLDWLISVQLEYEFSDLTLFTAINYIDCYLSRRKVNDWRSVHTLAVTAIYLATKTIEVIPMRISDCMAISDNLYSHSSIMKMEKVLLNVIDWNVFIFTPHAFIKSWLQILLLNNQKNNNNKRVIEKYKKFISLGMDSFAMHKKYLTMSYFDVISYLIYLASFQREIRDRYSDCGCIDIELLMFMSNNDDLLKKIKRNYYKPIDDAIYMVIKPRNKQEEECTTSIRDKYCIGKKYGESILSLIKNVKID